MIENDTGCRIEDRAALLKRPRPGTRRPSNPTKHQTFSQKFPLDGRTQPFHVNFQ